MVVGKEDVLDSVGLKHNANGMESGMENMLVWAGMELRFIIGARVELQFGFVWRTVLVTQGCVCHR